MTRGAFLRGVSTVAIVAAIGMILPACGGGGGGGGGGIKSGDQDIYLKKFLIVDRSNPPKELGGTGTTNAFRDTRLLFVFNTAVDIASVTSRTIRIGIPTSEDLFLESTGQFQPVEGHPNWVIFDPAFSKGNRTSVPDNPFGFDANAQYEVHIPAFGEQESVIENLVGDPIVMGFRAKFQTSSDYIQNLVQPRLESTIPSDGETGVDSNADIILKFDEPMLPDSFRIGETIIVRNLTTDRPILGTVRFSADAETVTFRPVFGYGRGPYDIFVRLTRDVTNLSGNPIPREIRLQFQTGLDLTAPEFGDITETFESNTFEDRTFVTKVPYAAWNSGVTSGLLAGILTSGTLTITPGTQTYAWPPWSWGNNFSSQWQTLYLASEMASPRTLVGFDWWGQSAITAVVTNVKVNMGHNNKGSVTTTFTSNFSDTPVNVCNQNSYTIPIMGNPGGWITGPQFQSSFRYNGSDHFLLELFNTCGATGYNTTWAGLWNINNPTSGITRTAYSRPPAAGAPAIGTSTYHHDIRLHYLVDQSEAQSLFYNSQIRSPNYLDPLFFPGIEEQPAGTTSEWKFQGAPEDPLNVGKADPENAGPWQSDLTKVSGFQYVRFHVKFAANQQTQQVPAYESIILPFIFFK